MKAQIISASLLFTLLSCQKSPKPQNPTEQIATPTPVAISTPTPFPTPIPTPKQTPTPEPTPQARLAPKGVYYVVKGFSVPTDSGIYGFRPGKQVKLIKEDGFNFVVTDGAMTGTATSDCFTNDLSIADRILEQQRQIAVQLPQQIQPVAQTQASTAHRADKNAIIQRLQQRKELLKVRIREIEYRMGGLDPSGKPKRTVSADLLKTKKSLEDQIFDIEQEIGKIQILN